MLVNKKALERKLCQLNFIPTTVICVIIATFFCVKFIELQRTNEDRRLDFIATLFNDIDTTRPEVFTRLADNILARDAFYTIALLNDDGKILLARGVTSNLPSPPSPSSSGQQTNVLKIEQKSYFYLPVNYREVNRSISGWLVISKDSRIDTLWFYKALVGFLALVVIAFTVTLVLTRRFEKTTLQNLSLIEKNLKAIQEERFADIASVPEPSLFSPLGQKLQTLAKHIATSRADLQHAIDQSLVDLNETLETVEIQNIEIDLARKNALQANQATSEFLANTSHEVRTPINGIIGFANLLRKTPITEQQAEYIDTIEESAKVLLLNINDIIDYSRLEIGKLNLDYKPVDIRAIIGESQKFVLAQINAPRTSLQCDIDEAIPAKLLGDAMRLKQVYSNLLRSTIELSKSPNVSSKVNISTRSGNKLSLEIRISARGDYSNDILLHEARDVLGTPSPDNEHLKNKHLMSLIIARGLVDRMQGKLGIDIEAHAASFWFTVALGQTNDNTNQLLPRNSDNSENTAEKVLIVDDTQANRRLVCELLKDWGINTDQAASGEEAIALSQANHYSLILMDIQMPGLNGFETTENIRKHEKTHEKPRTPIIALTAHAVETEKSRLLISGMDDFASKPIGENELHELLSRWAPQSFNTKNSAHTRTHAKTGSATSLPTPEEASALHMPVAPVNVSACLNLAKGKYDLAKDMLKMLIDGIAEDLPAMQNLWKEQKLEALHEIVHRIHGGACYCGVPQLQKISAVLDKQLKDRQYDSARENIPAMFAACEALLAWRETHDLETLFQASEEKKNPAHTD